MIVLNGLPFIKYNLESLYPFAHEIIVVEGACRSAASIAHMDGHSEDGTLEFLQEFAASQDPEHKLKLVTASDEGITDGFWEEKGQMSQAYAKRASGNYLWQIDVDEFYMPKNVCAIIQLLERKPEISAVSFYCTYFWGGIDYCMDGFSFRTSDYVVHRLFAWSPGCKYVSHRPPTVINSKGQDLRSLEWLAVEDTLAMDIRMYHYDMILPKQALNKSKYYSNVNWHALESQRILEWKSMVYDLLEKPFHIYTIYSHMSWLVRYEGVHPPCIRQMVEDIQTGKWPGCELRRTDDIEKMLNSYWFRLLQPLASVTVSMQVLFHSVKLVIREGLIRTPLWKVIQCLRGRGN